MAERRRGVSLFPAPGGGHRGAAEAVAEAVARHEADDVEVLLVDALHNYAPTPFNRLPGLYPRMVRTPRMWGMGFRVSNGRQRGRVLTRLIWPSRCRASPRLGAGPAAPGKGHEGDAPAGRRPAGRRTVLHSAGRPRPAAG